MFLSHMLTNKNWPCQEYKQCKYGPASNPKKLCREPMHHYCLCKQKVREGSTVPVEMMDIQLAHTEAWVSISLRIQMEPGQAMWRKSTKRRLLENLSKKRWTYREAWPHGSQSSCRCQLSWHAFLDDLDADTFSWSSFLLTSFSLGIPFS